MFEVIINKPFVAAHRLKLYDGSFEPLHGHNWKTEIRIRGEQLDSIEILIDFLDVKKEAEAVYEKIHYTYLNENQLFSGKNPSAEQVARYLFTEIAKRMNRAGIKVNRVTVWETDDCAASFFEE